MYLPFENMPGDSRIWVYQSDRKLNKNEIDFVTEKLEAFCNQWNTHGNLMPTSFDIKFDQIIILAVDESKLGTSGCSIDSSVRQLKEIESQLGINLLDQGKVSIVKSERELSVNPALGLLAKVKEGILSAESIVLNPEVYKKSDLKENWLIPAKESWLNKFFMN